MAAKSNGLPGVHKPARSATAAAVSERRKSGLPSSTTSRITNMFATTAAWPSGTRCAAQMAEVPVSSASRCMIHASFASATTSVSAQPVSETVLPAKPCSTASRPISSTASRADVQRSSAIRRLASVRSPWLRRKDGTAGRLGDRQPRLVHDAACRLPVGERPILPSSLLDAAYR
eukprot:5620715-Prymnesium_polylepis.1